MITPAEIYWITRLDYVRGGEIGLLILACAVLFTMVFGLFDAANAKTDKEAESARRCCVVLFSISIPVILLSILALIFTPSTKEAAAMYIVPRIANSEFVQKDLPKEARELYDLTKEYIRKEIQK